VKYIKLASFVKSIVPYDEENVLINI